MSWKTHVNQVLKKIAFGINCLLKIRYLFPKYILHTVYACFIESHLTYGIESWGNACQTVLKPLYLLQKRALRIINFLPPSASVSEIFPIEGILTIHQLAYYRLAILLHRLINTSLALPDIIVTTGNRVRTLRTPPETLLSVYKVRTNYGKQRIGYIGCNLWNCLNPSLKKLKSLSLFKKELKTSIIWMDSNFYK